MVVSDGGLMNMWLQVVMTANTFVWAYIGMPHSPADDAAAERGMIKLGHLTCMHPCVPCFGRNAMLNR